MNEETSIFEQACLDLQKLLPAENFEEIDSTIRGFWGSRGRYDLLLKIWYHVSIKSKNLTDINLKDIEKTECYYPENFPEISIDQSKLTDILKVMGFDIFICGKHDKDFAAFKEIM